MNFAPKFCRSLVSRCIIAACLSFLPVLLCTSQFHARTMGEFDMEKIKVLVPEIDYKAAGLSEADMNIYGISVMQDEISSELSDTLGDFEEIQRPFEERKAAVKEMKEQIRQQAEQKAEDIESYVMLNFKSYRAKSSFMLRFGFRPDDKIIPGEMFSDMVERVE